jgi:predicted metalloprotease with PDZ domain
MNRILLVLLLGFQGSQTFTQSVYVANAKSSPQGKMQVTAIPDPVLTFPRAFSFPRMVPGTYAVYDFGRFVDTLHFYINGERRVLPRSSTNHWDFSVRPDSVVYTVSQTWFHKAYNQYVFEPAGTLFDSAECYVFNNHAIFGYWEETTSMPVEAIIHTHPDFFPASGLDFERVSPATVVFKSESYHQWVDSPVMLFVPDTVSLKVGSTDVLVAIYNPSKSIRATDVAETLNEMLFGTLRFLEKLPVERYAFLIYMPDKMRSVSAGALEHSFSSFYYLPFMGKQASLNMIQDVGAHEFFHILTPLNLHAIQIHDFDYDTPQMSAHLWLYEGVTEYNSGLMQVRENLMDETAFLAWILDKKRNAGAYREDISFWDLSLYALDKHKDQYGNVYQKGALIGLALDLLILSENEGKLNLLSVLKSLSRKYGQDRPFEDEKLFGEIGAIAGSPVQKFLEQHIKGTKPLPLDSLLQLAGYQYNTNYKLPRLNPGFHIGSLNFNRAVNAWYIASKGDILKHGRKGGLQMGDVLISLNGQSIESDTGRETLKRILDSADKNQSITLLISRKTKKGEQRKELKIKPSVSFEAQGPRLVSVENPNSRQLQIRGAWIKK